ncbi:hypothetical protein NA57DRAFT_22652, partial [Rhizodiscina lignyota]
DERWTSRLDFDWRLTEFDAVVSERIQPFKQPVRDLLIDLYCPKQLRDLVRQNPLNENCLIRPYLGRRKNQTGPPSQFPEIELCDFPLHVDQMEHLGLHTHEYARIMADTLAYLHWELGVDASGLEFVLAPGRPQEEDNIISSDSLGEHAVWILDFDAFNGFRRLDNKAVPLAVAAFLSNERYFPRPGPDPKDEALWNTFKQRYLETSDYII